MPKADRILANLPPTFRLRGDPSALRALVDAYGGELQTAENSLVAVMRAHWVQFADAGERTIEDLRLFAALYGLAPRPDESVEEFRDHLRRYVRTYLDGTVTVQGILRITAEALGLHIEDDALDTWWDRSDPVLVTSVARGADAAALVLGVPAATVAGADAQPATLVGRADVGFGVDLTAARVLRIALDGHGALPVDLTAGAANPAAVSATELVAAIEAGLGRPGVARVDGGHLVLVSETTGTGSEVRVEDGPDDAADLVLGLRPRTYAGSDPVHARIVGTADLSSALDLAAARYLRVVVDGHHAAEVDCAALAASPSAVDVAQVTDAINAALGLTVASDDGRLLTLTSPTSGEAGSVVLADPAAQPATTTLFGTAAPVAVGAGARPARLVSDRRIGLGVDLSRDSRLRIALDTAPPVTIDVAGPDPAATTPAEVVAALNEGLGAQAASHDGDRITLVSPTAGAAGAVQVDEVDGDAAEAVLGLRPRSARGTAPVTAAVVGTVDLSAGVDLSSRYLLRLGLDGRTRRDLDLRGGIDDVTHATVAEIKDALNAALGADPGDPVASDDGAHLQLVSTSPGAAGSIDLQPLRDTLRRRFVTRARVTDDAATTVLGFTARTATGRTATVARLAGPHDLSGGVDLSVDRYLRLTVGDRTPVEIDCAGPRPRATTPAEVVAAITTAYVAQHPTAPGPIAGTDGRTLVLTDPEPGASSRILLEPPHALDALDRVLGVPPMLVRGRGAAGVHLAGTVDLSAGVGLPADAALRIGVGDAPPVDVPVGDGSTTATRQLSQLVAQVNLALAAQVAAHDGTHLLLVPPATATASRLVLEAPTAGTDVTAAVLGFAAPRTYVGQAAAAARVAGTVDLTAGADLRTAHVLRLAVDGGAPVAVDLTAAVPEADRGAVGAVQVAAAIRAATTAESATLVLPGGVGIQVTSPTTGPSSRVEILRPGAGDAAPLLLGAVGASAAGTDPEPAVLDGTVDLLGPVDLSVRSVLRVAVDGGEPVDADLAGIRPSATLLAEIVAAIDAALPGVAQAGPSERLRLVSPTVGPGSRVEIVPVRHLEVVEYPPVHADVEADVAHGSVLTFTSTGSADVPATIEVDTARGIAWPRLGDPAGGWSVRVAAAIGAGGHLVLEPTDAGGVTATVVERGLARVLPPELVHVVPEHPGPGARAALTVGRGRNRWSWTECRAARFDAAVFDTDRFAGEPCTEEAVFDVSRFSPTEVPAVFGSSAARSATAHVRVTWDSHAAGTFEVNLPRDLDARFGRVFDEARFGAAEPERIAGVVTEPELDPDRLVRRINLESRLVEAKDVPVVPLGWTAVTLPFRDLTPLTLGRAHDAARLYVTGPGLAPRFVEIAAAEPGPYGNDIRVSARLAGPEIYDVEVSMPGARFENARAVVLGPDLPTLADRLLTPGPVGVAAAKAAGVRAIVTRDRATPAVTEHRTHQDGPRPDEEGTP